MEWKVTGGAHAYMVMDNKTGGLVADCYDNLKEARLIAAAPDLYEALKQCKYWFGNASLFWIDVVGKALAKVESNAKGL